MGKINCFVFIDFFCELFICICNRQQIWISLKETCNKFFCEYGDGFVSVMVRQYVDAEGCTTTVKFPAVRGIFGFATTAVPALGWDPFSLLPVCSGTIHIIGRRVAK
jgi:hypothetical protein